MPVTMYRGHTYQILWKRFIKCTVQERNPDGSLICILIDGHRHPAEAILLATDTPEMACTQFIDRMIEALGPILSSPQATPRLRDHSRKRRRAFRNMRKRNLTLATRPRGPRCVMVRSGRSMSRTQRRSSGLAAV